jgi:aerobic carbon-monoxide dehydrogenase large subunit
VSILGTRVLRREDPRFLVGKGRYVENLPLDGALTVTFVRSLLAHARIGGVDVSAATALPNVQVLTGADVDIPPLPPPPLPGLEAAMTRPLVATDVVRFVGEIVAVVVSEDRASGADAAELVAIDYEPLPVVVSPQDAAKDEVLLFPDVGTNVAARSGAPERDESLFDGCEVVVSGSHVSQRMAACPLEPRSAAAELGPDGRLIVHAQTQAPHRDLPIVAGMLGLDPSQVHLVGPDIGGGFGVKFVGVEELLVAWLARRLGRPVRWTETRSESMVSLPHGRAQEVELTIGGMRDGSVLAYRLDILQDGGAYPMLGCFLPNFTALLSSGVYAIPKIEVAGRSVVTNTTPVTTFRGAGRPEATQALELALDLFAAEIGMDPADVRRRNFVPNDAFPYATATGATYDSGNYGEALELALRSLGVEQVRAEQRSRREQGAVRQLGIGISAYTEITNPIAENEFGQVEISGDGSAILRSGSLSTGQGHETTFAMIVAARLGLPVEKVTVVQGDTDEIAKGTGTYGSKSTQIGGAAAALAAEKVVEQAKGLVAGYLETSPADIVLDETAGRLHVAGAPATGMSWSELAERAAGDGRSEELKAEHEFQAGPTFPFGAHVAVVEVDTETGQVELQRFVAVDDAGTLINPVVAQGQVHGGVATGVAQALYEDFVYDEDGTPLTSTFLSYAFPSAADLPSWEAIEMETPTPANALGAKGIGESGTIGATPAVHNAVLDALSPYGVNHVDLPANGENVWRALREAKA